MGKPYSLLLSFTLLLFTALLLILCHHNRLASDDFLLIWDVRNKGVCESVRSMYMDWSGRYSATFLLTIFYKCFGLHDLYYSYFPLLSAMAAGTGCYFLITNITAFSNVQLSALQRIFLGASFTMLLFFLSVNIGETWFWFCAQGYYLWSIVAFIWGLALITNPKNPLLSTIGAACCFIFVGGASELFAMMLLICCFIFIMVRIKKAENFKKFLASTRDKKLLISSLFLGLAFFFLLIAPGNYLRAALFPERHFFTALLISAKSMFKFFLLYLPGKLLFVFAFGMPFFIAGTVINGSQIFLWLTLRFRVFFFRISVLFITMMCLFFLIMSYIMMEAGPARAWFFMSFIFEVYVCILFFYAGFRKVGQLRRIKNVSAIVGCITLLFFISDQYRCVSEYSTCLDMRISYLQNLNRKLCKDTLILLDPLPPSGILYSAELSKDTNNFVNQQIRLAYDLKFHIAVKPMN
jgi:hypothetical protein